MRKHEFNLARIIQAKADFLISLQANLGMNIRDAQMAFAELDATIDAMPRRGFRQRERQKEAAYQLDEKRQRFHARVGAAVLGTYGFVEAHQKLLPPGMRKLLLGGGKR